MKKNANSLYVHVPFCKHLCNFCDFYKQKLNDTHSTFDSYHQYMKQSLIKLDELLLKSDQEYSELETVYLGGGTPSLWDSVGANFFTQNVLSKFKLAKDYEFSIEVDPAAWSEQGLGDWKLAGANRFSIGIQSMNPSYIKMLDRAHTLEDAIQLLEYASKSLENFSVDFMLGIPSVDGVKRNIEKELEQVLSYNPRHISLYIFTVPRSYPNYHLIPEDDVVEAEYKFVQQYLGDRGLIQYEVSNYAFEGFESRHNWKYWRGESVMALGPSATGLMNSSNDSKRYKWLTSNAEFQIENLTQSQIRMEQAYTRLRTREGLVCAEYFEDSDEFKKLMEHWSKNEWASYSSDRLVMSRSVYVAFDTYFNELLRFLL